MGSGLMAGVEKVFWGLVVALTIYIASTLGVGLYYDYNLIPGYPLMYDLGVGALPVDEYLSRIDRATPDFRDGYLSRGRYTPLWINDFFLLEKVFSPADREASFQVFWIYQAALFLAFIVALVSLVRRLTGSRGWALGAALLILLHAGFWYSFTTLTAGTEAKALAYLTIGLAFYAKFLESRRPSHMLLGCGALLVACFIKEPIAPAVLAFVGSHILFTRKTAARHVRVIQTLAVGCAVTYLVAYAVSLWSDVDAQSGSLYTSMFLRSKGVDWGVESLIRNLVDFVRSDPAVVFLLIPLAGVQFAGGVGNGRGTEHEKLVASLFIGGLAWVLMLLVLGISDAHFQYYMVPAYGFAIPALASMTFDVFWRALPPAEAWRRYALAPMTLFLGVITIWATFSHGQYPGLTDWVLNNRADGKGWKKTLDRAGDLVRENSSAKTHFYFYHSPRGATIELYESFTSFLLDQGLSPRDFDLTYPSNDDVAWYNHQPGREFGAPTSPWSWRRNGRARDIQSGDYVVVNALWPIQPHNKAGMLRDYSLVFSSDSFSGCKPLTWENAYKYTAKNLAMGLHAAFPTIFEAWIRYPQIEWVRYWERSDLCSPFINQRTFHIFRKR